ncbi:MAG: 1-(5-phosphoribosyl)-5-[(5-phosphoribosylamino)methylideneamino] imidazole-4-carboxamide isomerase [Thaumarchaeota archaeon]|nr:1-(5-phosphoribosyl)-5-[(5-phosphoribosylamino)methylideneamino] imidazole-4-carboxamide isomerase [Nitrososphaerota archaeon]
MKIIPAIDLMNKKVVRLLKGNPDTKKIYSDDPYKIAKMWENQGADMIQFVDLDAALGLGSNLSIIKKTIDKLTIPSLIAGGLRNEHLIREALELSSGIILGTVPFTNKKLLQKFVDYKDKIIISIDQISRIIVINGWKNKTNIKISEGMKDLIKFGFSNFLLTNVEKDGTLEGIDIDLFYDVCKINSTHIFAAGGISNLNDVKKLENANVAGIVLGKVLYEGLLTINDIKKTCH